jgi:predicted transcriptional regulator
MKRLQVRIDDDLDNLLRGLAEREHLSKAEVVRRLVRHGGEGPAPAAWETADADQVPVDNALYA